jgi:cytochrome P450
VDANVETQSASAADIDPQAAGFPFDPRDPAFRADPYPTYERLREQTPVLATPIGMLVLSRHADCVRLLHHPTTSTDQRNSALYQAFVQNLEVDPFEGREPSFLFLDPPDHTRLRGLVSHAFTPRRVRDLGTRIAEIVDELIDEHIEAGEMEVIEDFAYLLPVRVICELLGVPTKDHEIFKDWSRQLARGLDPEFMLPQETVAKMQAASEALQTYFEELIGERRKEPGPDMLSALIGAEEAGDKLTHGELLSTLGLLLIAGHETTVNLIGNAVLQFSRHPDQYAKLCADRSLTKSAIEEVLRFDPPVQITGRISMIDLEFDGHVLSKGQQGLCLIGGANRDPGEFGPSAPLFDITRTPNNHVAFGAGIHFCLGANLARLEAQTAIEALARRVGPFELADEPSYRENFVLRGLSRLPIEFGTP